MDSTPFQCHLLGRAWRPRIHGLEVIFGVTFARVVATRGGQGVGVRIILLALAFLVEGTADRVRLAQLHVSRDSASQKAG